MVKNIYLSSVALGARDKNGRLIFSYSILDNFQKLDIFPSLDIAFKKNTMIETQNPIVCHL